jgi:hypothetical protein
MYMQVRIYGSNATYFSAFSLKRKHHVAFSSGRFFERIPATSPLYQRFRVTKDGIYIHSAP